METSAVAAQLRKIVAEIAEMEPEDISFDAHFIKDLDLDSMTLLEIAAAVEKQFKVTIPESELKQLTTINQAVALAQKYLPAA